MKDIKSSQSTRCSARTPHPQLGFLSGMTDWNTIFQNCWYVGNNFNAILYGTSLVP